MNDDQALSSLAAGYALGTLTPEELVAYEAFLAGSADARVDAAAYDSTAAALGLDAPAAAPRPQLKADIMAMIAVTPQLAPLEDTVTAPEPGMATAPEPGRHVAPFPAPGPASRAEAKSHARWFARPVGVLTAAAAAAALFAGGTLVGIGLNAGSTAQQQQASALAHINSAPDVQRATAAVSSGGTATLVWSDTLGKSALLINGLSDLPADKTYELWYIRGDVAHPAGTMDASAASTTWRVLDGTKTPGDTIGVTVEPEGGSEQPSTTPLVAIPS